MGYTILGASQNLIPPLLLSYFYAAWKLCTFRVAPFIIQDLGRPLAGIYTTLSTLFILRIATIYLRLYFLPRDQSIPPTILPPDIRAKKVIFECLSLDAAESIRQTNTADDDGAAIVSPSSEAEMLVNRCYKGRCGGRWKPARARHCSQCGVCRGGFDHHCPFFANCLTAPYLPAFLALLTYTPFVVLILSIPLYSALYHRSLAAWSLACDSGKISGWWEWRASWVIAGGPVGRYAGGLILGWRELDRLDGGGVTTVACAAIVAFGHILALICIGLAYNAISAITSGDLLIDQGRTQAYKRTLVSIHKLQDRGLPVPDDVLQTLERWSDKRHFFVPGEQGRVISTLPGERVYDHGSKKNWEIIMGKGWRWLLPWVSIQRGMSNDVLFNWPVNEEVKRRLSSVVKGRESDRDI